MNSKRETCWQNIAGKHDGLTMTGNSCFTLINRTRINIDGDCGLGREGPRLRLNEDCEDQKRLFVGKSFEVGDV